MTIVIVQLVQEIGSYYIGNIRGVLVSFVTIESIPLISAIKRKLRKFNIFLDIYRWFNAFGEESQHIFGLIVLIIPLYEVKASRRLRRLSRVSYYISQALFQLVKSTADCVRNYIFLTFPVLYIKLILLELVNLAGNSLRYILNSIYIFQALIIG